MAIKMSLVLFVMVSVLQTLGYAGRRVVSMIAKSGGVDDNA